MVVDRAQQAGEGEAIGEELKLHAQVSQGKEEKEQGHHRQTAAARGLRRGLSGGWRHRRASTGSRVGARPMLDQLPTAMPRLRAMANQNRVLPPKKISASRGRRVVKEV